MCRYPVASPRALHCGLGQQENSYGLARDSQELCGTEHVFISAPTSRVAKEGVCSHDFQEQRNVTHLSPSLPTETFPLYSAL